MIVAISQPEHFPYLGYFQKMSRCDIFVILDHVQFSGPRSFQNRNRFIDRHGNQQWFTVPVAKGSYSQSIRNVRVSTDPTWRKKITRKLYLQFRLDLADIYDPDLLVNINIRSIIYLSDKLEIKVPTVLSSELSADGAKSKLLANICRELKASVYLSGPGGRGYLDEGEFKRHGISVQYFDPSVPHHYSALQS